MAPPVWSVGQVLTASDVNTWFVPTFAVYKTGSTTRNTLTLSADPDLTGTLPAANAFYYASMGINYSCATGGVAILFTVPSGWGGAQIVVGPNGATQTMGQGWATQYAMNSQSGPNGGIFISGMISTAATTGTFVITWASNSGPASLSFGAGSYFIVWRVG